MNIGKFRIEQLSEGIFDVSESGTIQKVRNHQKKNLDTSALRIGLDPVLIDTGNGCVLLDTGLGIGLDNKEPNKETSNILTNLEIFGYSPSDVRAVILSHLHYDHAAGLSYTNQAGNTQATLPNAKIYVQKSEWEACLDNNNSTSSFSHGPGYVPDDLYRLFADNRFVLINQDRKEIMPGITVIRTGGHTPGHQVVHIKSENEAAFYCGDLIPNELYLNHYTIDKSDIDGLRARKAKMLLMQQAARQNAMLLFYHSIYKKAGKLTRDSNRIFVLKNI